MNNDKLALVKGAFLRANQKTHPGRVYSEEEFQKEFNEFLVAQSLTQNKETASEIVARWNLEAELEKAKKDAK